MSGPVERPHHPAATDRPRVRLVAPLDAAWRRRAIAGLLAFAGLAVLAWRTTPGGGVSAGMAAVVAAAGAATLASYIPERGWRPALGCRPCAVAAVGSVPVALGLLASGATGVAVVVGLAGLGQRLRSAGAACAT